ncbi:MAG: hypothetical protein MUC48_02250 [Leptolyngbya sp. Prado105]|jgi:hypothetical protein|nr:hypothetical protein [Leptolyngbya sp. Prado105]
MAFKKKATSPSVKLAKVRISGMRSIDPALNLGDGMTLETYEAALEDAEQKISAYNTALANITQLQSDARTAEQLLSDRSERMLNLVAGRYGKRSNEYEKAGGTKRVPGAKRTKKAEAQTSVTA